MVTDTANGTKVHRLFCRTISEATFGEKVVENGAKNGRYYLFLSAEDGEQSLGARPCPVCR